SHKTRHPYRGERHDLHAAAHAFLSAHGFYETSDTGLSPQQVFLEYTLVGKLARIGELGCEAFVDDLPEVLGEPAFPIGVHTILFEPGNVHEGSDVSRVTSWEACGDLLLPQGVRVTAPDPAAISKLVAAAELGAVRKTVPLAGGRNNRVFRVEAENGEAVLKA